MSLLWTILAEDDAVESVLVLAHEVPQDPPATVRELTGPPLALGPKANGLMKPVGVGVVGPARNEILQVIGEADVVVATPEASFADTSVAGGNLGLHVSSLIGALPELEVTRMAIGGESVALPCQRAADLRLIDAIVDEADVDAAVRERLELLLPPADGHVPG
jgi:hypothetical protein